VGLPSLVGSLVGWPRPPLRHRDCSGRPQGPPLRHRRKKEPRPRV